MAAHQNNATAAFADLMLYLNGSGIMPEAQCDTSSHSAINQYVTQPLHDTGSMSIIHLPTELLCRILSNVPYDQRLAITTVCHTFSDALRRPSAWPNLLLRARGVYPTPPSKQLVSWLTPRYPPNTMC